MHPLYWRYEHIVQFFFIAGLLQEVRHCFRFTKINWIIRVTSLGVNTTCAVHVRLIKKHRLISLT